MTTTNGRLSGFVYWAMLLCFLVLSWQSSAQAQIGDPAACSGPFPAIAPGDTLDVSLDTSTDCFVSGRLTDRYSLALAEDTLLRITTNTDGFDPLLILLDPNVSGSPLAVRGAVDSTALNTEYLIPAGNYLLIAGSRLTDESAPPTGNYQMSLSSSLAMSEIQDVCTLSTLVQPGLALEGELTANDCRDTSVVDDETSPYQDAYQFQLGEGQIIYPMLETEAPVRLIHWFNGGYYQEVEVGAGEDARLSLNREGAHLLFVAGQSVSDLGSYQLSLPLSQPELETVSVSFTYQFSNYRETIGEQTETGDSDNVLQLVVDAVFADDDIFEVVGIQEASLDGNAYDLSENPGIVAFRSDTPALMSLSGNLLDAMICPDGFTGNRDCNFRVDGGFLISDFWPLEGDFAGQSGAVAGHPVFGEGFRNVDLPINKSAWSAQIVNHTAQRQALEALYQSTDGSSWSNQDGWLGDAGTECSWYGISCNAHGNITEVDLSHNNLAGNIPTEISDLVTATAIDLSYNQLTGQVPQAVLDMGTVNVWANPELTGIEFGGSGACDVQTPLALGAAVNGELTPFQDCYFDDDRIMADFYRLDLSAETEPTLFSVQAHADDYYPHMGVLDASGHEGQDIVETQVQDNDLSFEVALPPGEYVLYIHGGTEESGNVAATGSYTLNTVVNTEPNASCMQPTWVMKDVELEAAISTDDCLDTFNDPSRHYDSYAIWLPAGETVVASVTSEIASQLLHFIAYDFNTATRPTPAGQQHSLVYTASESGWHQFAVYNTPDNPLQAGNYTIAFGNLPDIGDSAACTNLIPIAPGDSLDGTLSQANDCYSPQGRMIDHYELDLQSDTVFRVTANTDSFDPTLVITTLEESPFTIAARSGIFQHNFTSEYVLPAGQYHLVVTSRITNPVSPLEGNYSLSISNALASSDIQASCLPLTAVRPGAVIPAELSTSDCRYTDVVNDETSPYQDSYQLFVREGELVYPMLASAVPVKLLHRFNSQIVGEYQVGAGEDARLSLNRSGMHVFQVVGQDVTALGNYEFSLLSEQPSLETVPVTFTYTFDSYRDIVDGESEIGEAQHVLTAIVDAVFADDDVFEVINIREAMLDGHSLTVGDNPGIVASRDNTPALLSLSGDLLDVLICPDGFSLQLDCPFGAEGGILLSDFFLENGESIALAGHPALGAAYRARSYPIRRDNWSASIVGFGAPSGSDNVITVLEDQSHIFDVADFGFSDDDNVFISVKITSLPQAGRLQLNGSDVSAGQEVAVTELPQFTYSPASNAYGDAYSMMSFQVRDNGLDADEGRVNSSDLDPSPNTIQFDVLPVNDAPKGTTLYVDLAPNTAFNFSISAFGFSDSLDLPTVNQFASVTIESVPGDGEGDLLLNDQAVTAGDVIVVSELSGLTYLPPQDVSANDFTRVNFKVTDDGGDANGGIDTDETSRSIVFNVGVVPPVDPDPDPTPDDVAGEIDDLNSDLDDIESIPLEEGQPVSDEVVNQVGNALDRTNSLAQQVTESLPDGEAGVSVALDALDTMSRTLKASAKVSASGGEISSTSAANSINSVATVLNSLSTRSENITDEQRATVKALVSETVGNSSDLIRTGASNDELVSMVAATSAVINAASAAGGDIDAELVTKTEALVTKAVKTGLSSFSTDIDVEDPVQVESLLRDNPEALEFAIEASVAVKSRIQPDSDAVQEELSSRGIEGSASERFTEVLNAVSNPDGVSVDGSSGSEILLAALVNFLTGGGAEALLSADGRQVMALSAGDVNLTVDALIGTALITAPGETYSTAVVNTRIISSSVPEGLSFMRDGRALIVSDGVAIELAPVAVDLIGFTDTIEKAGFEMNLRDGGVIDIKLSDSERFVGVFAFDNISGASTVCDSTTTLIAPVTEVDMPSYAFGVQCGEGAMQHVLPFVHDPAFYRSMQDYGLSTRTDRNTGVISIANTGKFKPGFFVSALNEADEVYLNANQDERGVAFRFMDVNNDGQQDALFYTAAGVQPMYGVSP